MCLLVLAYKVHPDYPFLFVGNRDEFLDRPTQAADWWDDHPDVFAGRDLRAGGTWTGINKKGNFAALTNWRDGHDNKGSRSRGDLVVDFLTADKAPAEYIYSKRPVEKDYNKFNLLLGLPNSLYYYSNAGEEGSRKLRGNSIYGLSNGKINSSWPKVNKAKKFMRDLVRKPGFQPDDLFNMMTDKGQARDQHLPNTNIPYRWEKTLSAMFIDTPEYGTMVTTVIAVDKHGKMIMEERGHKPPGQSRRAQINL
ncbi:MAG: NRDE family protein [Bacteroidota bacterium]